MAFQHRHRDILLGVILHRMKTRHRQKLKTNKQKTRDVENTNSDNQFFSEQDIKFWEIVLHLLEILHHRARVQANWRPHTPE